MEDGYLNRILTTPADYGDQSFQQHPQTVNSYDGDSSENNLLLDQPTTNLQENFPSNSCILSSKLQEPELELSELDMVQLLQLRKFCGENIKDLHPAVTEADVYAFHPSDLLKTRNRYFICFSKYTTQTKPKRVRTTSFGYRWKQQGRVFVLKHNGQPVAIRTYLSFVALTNTDKKYSGEKSCDPNYVIKACKNGGTRRHAIYTMEEITLLEDYMYEKDLCSKSIQPSPIPVLCHIVCKHSNKEEALYNTPTVRSMPIPDSLLPCSKTSSEEDEKLSDIFSKLESLDGSEMDREMKVLFAEISFMESTLLL